MYVLIEGDHVLGVVKGFVTKSLYVALMLLDYVVPLLPLARLPM